MSSVSNPSFIELEPETESSVPALPPRSGWRWFALVWLAALVYPLLSLFSQNRPLLDYFYVLLLLSIFVGVFIWAFFGKRWMDGSENRPLRTSSLVGMGTSYAMLILMFPVINWNGVGMLIYAGAFAGTQRSFWPGAGAILISVAVMLTLALREDAWLLAGSMVFFTLVSAVSNHLSYRDAIISQSLERSQQEVARVAKIAERERIARDLHDLLGHTLSVIVLKSELASRLAEKDPARAAKEIRDVERIARESLQEVRSAVRGYRSSGLEGELEGVRLACEAADLKLELYQVPLELEWALEQTLAFVLREAVTNTVRHAHAKHLWVSLERSGQGVRLSVWDDGTGQILEGNGVRGMRERVQALGGLLELDAKGKGVTVRLGV